MKTILFRSGHVTWTSLVAVLLCGVFSAREAIGGEAVAQLTTTNYTLTIHPGDLGAEPQCAVTCRGNRQGDWRYDWQTIGLFM